jgi:hypothetical protein
LQAAIAAARSAIPLPPPELPRSTISGSLTRSGAAGCPRP